MQHTARLILKKSILILLVFIQTAFYPSLALADTTETVADPADSTSESVESTPAQTTGPADAPTGPQETQETTGPTQPTGAAAPTYTYNEATGLWENEHYTWDPVTKQTKPKTPQTYSYNPQTKMWDTTEYYYSPEAGKYLPNTVSVATNPLQTQAQISNTGPNSNNTIDINNTTDGNFDLFFDARISNAIGQLSQSGDATVQGNTLGGDALTGDAQTLVNLLNMLQSGWGALGSEEVSTFVANIDGDVVGDLYIDPYAAGGTSNTNIDVSVASSGLIENDINVVAQSGNATVNNNTTGGDATSGNAQAVVNLLNLINSAISANQSFVGVLNINGTLEGDILLPPGMLEAIIAASGPNSNNTINNNDNDSLDVNVNQTTTIDNDINANASSGSANVSGNTNGGSATTGQANTNVTLLNLTGKKVVAKNAMLVFVNVLGQWVGLIMDAPAGSYAVAATGPGSNNTINTNDNDNIDVEVTGNNEIRNNVNATAASGDASVTGNTNGGSATSGDASVAVNVLNMVDSSFELSDWFGVLFINVFGSWFGSFGINTAYGNPKQDTPAATDNTNQVAASNATGQTFTFVPRATAAVSSTVATNAEYTAPAVTTAAPAVLANHIQTTDDDAVSAPVAGGGATQSGDGQQANLWWAAGGVAIAMGLLGIERYLTLRRPRLQS